MIGDAGLIPARLTGTIAPLDGAIFPTLTLLTSIFLHAGWLHFGMNSLFLVVIGRDVEPLLGGTRYIALFLLGGIVGGVVETLLAPTSVYPVIGASGAISAVFGAYLMRFAARPSDSARALGRRWSPETAAALRFGAAWLVLQALTAFAGLGIAVGAHFGGFVIGLMFGAGARPRARNTL